ncbi:MAG: hypothetical protein ACUVXA_00005 [Candidatus Jordarchaeum sp.]|uniref:hypothetical protein n=1 Tax=Candidatus Jordarchaeum sp. TaxID=2823881 RepID=UPI00404B540C
MYRQEEFVDRLNTSKSFADIFSLVEDAVMCKYKVRRAVMLGLTDLGAQGNYMVGAFHPVGSELIVLNKTPLRRIKEVKPEYYNAYLFHILLHEYLHSLGVLDENTVGYLTVEICRELLGGDHPATQMGAKGISHFFPFITYPTPEIDASDVQIEIVKNFRQQTTTYYC